MTSLRVVCAAGGTAGHIEPALNLADALVARGCSVSFLGSGRELETKLVPQRGYALHNVHAVPMPRRLSPRTFAFPGAVYRSVQEAKTIIEPADVVVGFGGYGAVPGYIAARRAHKPLVIHEANARAGFANRLGARLTSHVLATYPAVLPSAQQMGLPLRPAIAQLDRAANRAKAQAHFKVSGNVLLVFGGSQGARRINDALAVALPALRQAGIDVLHAHGSGQPALPAQPGYVPLAYIDRMDLAYAAADLVMCRAGAMTCAEVTAVGLPAVYVPLAIGNGEQALNAAPIVEIGGGLMLTDAALDGALVSDIIRGLFADPHRLTTMGASAAMLGERNAAARMADYVVDVGAA